MKKEPPLIIPGLADTRNIPLAQLAADRIKTGGQVANVIPADDDEHLTVCAFASSI